jgi:hypothetical protein
VHGLKCLNEKKIYLLDLFTSNEENLQVASDESGAQRLNIGKLIDACQVWRQNERRNASRSSSPAAEAAAVASASVSYSLSKARKTPGPDEQRLKRALELHNYHLEVRRSARIVKASEFVAMETNVNDESNVIDEYFIDNIGKSLANSSNRLGKECFVGRLPRDVFEDELLELVEPFGPIVELQLHLDPSTGYNRGYAFICFSSKENAQAAIRKLNNYEIRRNSQIVANYSMYRTIIFVGNLPANIDTEQLTCHFGQFLSE